MELRPYQVDIRDRVYEAWSRGARNVLACLATGGGKTHIVSDIVKNENAPVCVTAHRQELVSQMSLSLARNGVYHRIIASKQVVGFCVQLHKEELGESFYHASGKVAVAGVQTLVRREDEVRHWAKTVRLWVQDECHHILRDNSFGTAAAMFPNARGLGVTATPCRADGKGLGRDADGVMDTLITGITMRELIDAGYLTEYRIFAPPSDIHLENVKVSSTTGDYVAPQLRDAIAKSHIHGDVVEHYLKIAPGKRGITFATDIEAAKEISRRFNQAGVSSDVITGKTPDALRNELIRRFRTGRLTQLVNVDIFGEGFDLPTLEVVSMARPTQSYSLFSQQFGRALRPMEGKSHAIIIDHVGNTLLHGLPDAPRIWTLDRRGRRDSTPTDVIPTRTCPECTGVYERIYRECPFCGFYPEPIERNGPEQVDGDLFELDPETLKKMRAQVNKIKQDPDDMRQRMLNQGVKPPVAHSIANNHAARKEAHDKLHDAISWWGAHQRHAGRPDSHSYRRFYHKFGVDVLTAQTLPGPDALELAERIKNDYSGVG